MSIFRVEEVSEDAFFSIPSRGARSNPEYAIIYRRILDLKPHNGNMQAIKIDGKHDDLRKLMNSASAAFNHKDTMLRNKFKIKMKLASDAQKDHPSTLYIRKVLEGVK